MTKGEKREKKNFKQKHGMQESGRSVKYLVRLANDRIMKVKKNRDDTLREAPKKKGANNKTGPKIWPCFFFYSLPIEEPTKCTLASVDF